MGEPALVQLGKVGELSPGKREPGYWAAVCSVLGMTVVLAVSSMGMSPRPHPVRAEPTTRDTPTPASTWTTTSTFTPTPTDTPTPGTPTPTQTSTSTTRPSQTPEPSNTSEATSTRTPTRTPTGTPGLTPVTPIVTPIWVTGSATAVSYGTRLPVSGVEPTHTPTVTPLPTESQTPVPTSTRAPSPTVTSTPTPSDRLGPAAPSGVVATAGNAVVVLEWTAGTEPDLEGYRVYRSAAQGSGYSKMVSVDGKYSRYVDDTVTNDVTYYYVVTAFDLSGNESPFSEEVSITPSALKGMPASGATPWGAIAASPWLWMALFTITLFVLVGGRRSGSWFGRSAETETVGRGDDVDDQDAPEDADDVRVD